LRSVEHGMSQVPWTAREDLVFLLLQKVKESKLHLGEKGITKKWEDFPAALWPKAADGVPLPSPFNQYKEVQGPALRKQFDTIMTRSLRTLGVSTAATNLSVLDPNAPLTLATQILKLCETLHKEKEHKDDQDRLEAEEVKAKQTKQGIIEARYLTNNINYSNSSGGSESDGHISVEDDDIVAIPNSISTPLRSTPSPNLSTPHGSSQSTLSTPARGSAAMPTVYIEKSDEAFAKYLSTMNDQKRQKLAHENKKLELEERKLLLEEHRMQMEKERWEVERRDRYGRNNS